MIQMVLIKQMVPNSKRRRNVFKSCWNEPQAKPIPLYKKVLLPWELFESPKPHTRERLTTCVYLIITIKNHLVRSGCRGMGSASREGMEQPRAGFVCRAKGQRGRKSHIWPLLAAGRSWCPLAAGQFHTEVTGWGSKDLGFVLPWLLLALFAQGWMVEAARFCWEFWNSSAIRQEKSCSALSGSFLLLRGGVFVLGFTVVLFRGFGCGWLSSQSRMTLTLWEFFFHGRAF